MPKIVSYTPAWLSRPSSGFHLFAPSQESSGPVKPGEKSYRTSTNGGKTKEDYIGTTRTIARRGTEIFVVVGNTIRWSDLCMLKESWEEKGQNNRHASRSSGYGSQSPQDHCSEDTQESDYRVCHLTSSYLIETYHTTFRFSRFP